MRSCNVNSALIRLLNCLLSGVNTALLGGVLREEGNCSMVYG